MTRAKLRTAMAAMADQANAASDVAEQLGVSTSTLYACVDGKGQPKARARKLLGSGGTAKRWDHMRLGFAVQLGTARFLDTF